MSDKLPIARLREMFAHYNPRKPKPNGVEKLAAGIERFGMLQNIIVNKRTERVVGGHRRIEASEIAGYTELPVVWVDLDETAERELNLLLNNSAGEWDDDKLRDVLADLAVRSVDLSATGFSDAEIKRLLGAGYDAEPPDEFASPDEKTDTTCPKCGYEWNAPK